MAGDKLKSSWGEEIAIPCTRIIATSKYATMIDEHMQDQYFCADKADVVFEDAHRQQRHLKYSPAKPGEM